MTIRRSRFLDGEVFVYDQYEEALARAAARVRDAAKGYWPSSGWKTVRLDRSVPHDATIPDEDERGLHPLRQAAVRNRSREGSVCSVPGCDRQRHSKHYCDLHYTRMKRDGSVGAARGGQGRLREEDIPVIRRRLGAGESAGVIAKDHGVSRSAIFAVKSGANWAWVGADESQRTDPPNPHPQAPRP